MSIFWKKTVKVASASWAPPPNPRWPPAAGAPPPDPALRLPPIIDFLSSAICVLLL